MTDHLILYIKEGLRECQATMRILEGYVDCHEGQKYWSYLAGSLAEMRRKIEEDGKTTMDLR